MLAGLADDIEITRLDAPLLRRFIATLHGRGLSGRSLARTLSSWRAFYRFALERDAAVTESPCAGLKAPKSPKRLPAVLSPDEAVQLVTRIGRLMMAAGEPSAYPAYLAELRTTHGRKRNFMALLDGATRTPGRP